MAKSSNTSFATIYNIFLSRVTADMYMELTELDTYILLQDLLISAISSFEFPRINLQNYELSEIEDETFYCGKDSNNEVVTALIYSGGYFSCILTQEEILKQYPKALRIAYLKYKKGGRRNGNNWFIVPVENGIAFTTEDGKPPFAYLVKSLARIDKLEPLRDDYVATNLTKLLVQIIDIDKEGNPEVDLEMAAEFHANLREIASRKHNVDALTTLAKEVNVLSLGETGDATKNYEFLETYYRQFYDDAGVSAELFNSTSAGTLEYSENKDEAFMYDLRKQIENWFNYFLNTICKKKITKNTNFVFSYLNTSYKNREKMIDSSIRC